MHHSQIDFILGDGATTRIFPGADVGSNTWHSPGVLHHSQIDFILGDGATTRIFPGADVGSNRDLLKKGKTRLCKAVL